VKFRIRSQREQVHTLEGTLIEGASVVQPVALSLRYNLPSREIDLFG
jgi:hypothetical protein